MEEETYEEEKDISDHKDIKEIPEKATKKHSKNICKVCKVSFKNAKKLTNHVKKFHDFSNDDTNDKEVTVLADDDMIAPRSVEDFKKEKDTNVCNICKLKFLNGRMLKGHMAKHHPEIWKEMQKNTEVSGRRRNPKRDVRKKQGELKKECHDETDSKSSKKKLCLNYV